MVIFEHHQSRYNMADERQEDNYEKQERICKTSSISRHILPLSQVFLNKKVFYLTIQEPLLFFRNAFHSGYSARITYVKGYPFRS